MLEPTLALVCDIYSAKPKLQGKQDGKVGCKGKQARVMWSEMCAHKQVKNSDDFDACRKGARGPLTVTDEFMGHGGLDAAQPCRLDSGSSCCAGCEGYASSGHSGDTDWTGAGELADLGFVTADEGVAAICTSIAQYISSRCWPI